MILLHGPHESGVGEQLLPVGVALLAAGYLVLARRRGREPRGWSRWRTASFTTGCALLALGVLPQDLPFGAGDFRQHVLQHLLIGMFVPLGLVLGAPVTLVLRSTPTRWGRRLGRVLHLRPVRLLTHPVTALLLDLGGLVVLYLTPLYVATTEHPTLHGLVHLHFLAAGYLFAWVIAGPDPAPRRPSVPARLVVLGVAVAAHATLSQVMYAGLLVSIPVPPDQLRGAAELMYYGGDIAEILLALALVTTWRPRRVAKPRPDTGLTRSPGAVGTQVRSRP